MAKVDELEVLIKANTSQLKAGLDKTQSQVSSFGQQVSKLGAGISAKAGAVAGLVSSVASKAIQSISAQMGSAVERLDTLNNFPKVMSNLGIESGVASSAINKLSDDLRGLPTNLSDAVSAVQRLTAVNNNLEYSTDAFLALNNAILAGGATAQIQSSAIEQLSQAYAKGKPDMMEWRTIMQAMPAQLSQVAKAMGTTSTALGEGLRDGSISMNDFMNTIMRLNKEGLSGFQSFENQAKNSTGGVATAVTNLRIAIQRGFADIMNVIGQTNISGFINGIANAIGTAASYIAAFVKLIKQAIAWVQALFGGGSGSTEAVVKETSDSVEGLAGSVGSVGDALDSATGSAKKLKHQLAGFDEMNVLQEQTSGGGGGSGSGGGAGGVSIPDYKWDTSGITKGTDKVEKAFKELKNFLNKIFGKIDFDKLGKSFKKFYDDVQSALEPLKRILRDVWDNYLQPFITWTGNELLPAFLDALGGAINLLGQVLGAVWSNFLKPFIDDFLVPIAQFTGGVIVSVLNLIGDACRAIASSETGVNAVAATLVTIGAVIAAYKFATFQEQIHNLTTVAMELGTQGNIAVGGLIGKIVALNAEVIQSGSIFAGVKTIFTTGISGIGSVLSGFVETICSPAGIAILAVAAAITAVITAIEAIKLVVMNYESTHKNYITSEQLSEQIARDRERAVNDEKDAMNGLKDAIQGVNSANLDLVNAEENLRNSTKNLNTEASNNNMTTQEAIDWYHNLNGDLSNLNDSQLELAKSVAMYETAQDRSTKASEQYSNAVNKQTQEEQNLYDAQQRELRALLDEEAQVYANNKDWEGLSKRLQQLADDEYTFVDSQGNTVKRSREEMAWLTSGVADDIAKGHKEWDEVWKKFPISVRENADNIKNIYTIVGNEFKNKSKETANNYANGLINGLDARNGDAYWAGFRITNNMNKGAQAGIQSHSPSKKAIELGKFFGEGLIIGLDSETNAVKSAAEEIGNAMIDSMDEIKNYELSPLDFSSKLNTDFNTLTQDMEIEARETPVHVVVNVGEDKLLDKVISGINDISYLTNRNAINV